MNKEIEIDKKLPSPIGFKLVPKDALGPCYIACNVSENSESALVSY